MRRFLIACLLLLPLVAQSPALAPTKTLEIRFLSVSEGRKALTEGSEVGYFESLLLGDMRAKTGLPLKAMPLAEARTATRLKFAEGVEAFSPDEEAMLKGILKRIGPKVFELLPLLARTPFTFLKVGMGIEGGLPHTRGGNTVLSPLVLTPMTDLHKRGAFDALDGFGANLLIHEQAHILERMYPDRFFSFYTQILGFRRLDSLPDAPWIAERRVLNPDGPDLRWAFKVDEGGQAHWLRPDLILQSLDRPRMPQDFRKIAVSLEEKNGSLVVVLDPKGMPQIEDLDGVKGYVTSFPNTDENYHPHEILADLLGYYVSGFGAGDPKHPLRAKTAAWVKEHLQ
jgi:hypothetical protein